MSKSYRFHADVLTTATAATLAMVATLATVSSVQAKTPDTDFRQSVETAIDRTLRRDAVRPADVPATATVAVRIDAQGRVLSTAMMRSSGRRNWDTEALRTARTVAYPATGKPRTVAMVLGFNRAVSARDEQAARRLANALPPVPAPVRLAETVSAQPES